MRIVFCVAAVAFIVGSGASAATLVANGDFENGNASFSSGYTAVAPGPDNLFVEGRYTVAANPNGSHRFFSSYGDHTTGSGQFLIANGAGTAGTSVWSQTIATEATRTYSFSFWVSTANDENPALLDLLVTPASGPAFTLAEAMAPATAGVWRQVSGRFTASGPVTLSIINQNTTLSGNDFGIDDIAVTAVPEPATWGLMIAGFGLIGVAARRRRSAVTA